MQKPSELSRWLAAVRRNYFLLGEDRILRFLTYGCWFVCDDDIGKDTIRKGDSWLHGRVSVSYGLRLARKSM